ncbi:MAG: universal stress protein [Verrucomicrobiia bacterium]
MKDVQKPTPAKGARVSLHVKPGPALAGSTEAGADALAYPSHLLLKEILVPMDFSEGSEKALKYARKLAGQFGSSVTLLHVIQPMVYPAELGYPPTVVDTLDVSVRERIEERLATMAAGNEPMPVRTLVRTGQPYHEITTAAKELDADLIIISTHGWTGLKHVLMGSTAERVVRHAPCPVLTVRERQRDFV